MTSVDAWQGRERPTMSPTTPPLQPNNTALNDWSNITFQPYDFFAATDAEIAVSTSPLNPNDGWGFAASDSTVDKPVQRRPCKRKRESVGDPGRG